MGAMFSLYTLGSLRVEVCIYWFAGGLLVTHANWNPLYTINLEPLFTSIDDYVKPLSRKVDEILAQSSHSQVTIVAHSMGGLAARRYLQSDDSAGCVAKLITLGTPHHGTLFASWSPAPNAR